MVTCRKLGQTVILGSRAIARLFHEWLMSHSKVMNIDYKISNACLNDYQLFGFS